MEYTALTDEDDQVDQSSDSASWFIKLLEMTDSWSE